ncbi:hypothetical protein BGZ81_002381 [Podila clonocystis]|nr:hypothetical protein BGZ81_002381 [Podila clonocystis]
MNHVRRFLPVLPVFMRATPPSVWTADKFYTWLQEFNPSILAEANLTPDAFFTAWMGALAVQLTEKPESINYTLVAEARIRELKHKSDRVGAIIAIQISQEAPARVSLSEADLSAPVVLQPRSTKAHGTTFQPTTPGAVARLSVLSTSKSTYLSTDTIGKRKKTHNDQYPSKRYNGRTIFVISDSDDSESIADDMDSTHSDLEKDDEGESGWEDEDSDSSWDSEKDQSAPVLMKLGFKPMIDINLKCNNYIRQLCADIYSSGAQTIVLFDWDNQPVPESMLSINPRDSGVYSIIVQGRTSKSPTAQRPQRHGYILTTPRPFKEAADHEMFMLVCSLLYAGILHDKIVVVVTADIGMENIMLYMNERSISSVRLTARDLIPYLNRIVPGCFNSRSMTAFV